MITCGPGWYVQARKSVYGMAPELTGVTAVTATATITVTGSRTVKDCAHPRASPNHFVR